MIKVSVIIPIWNSVDKIGRCLESIISQTLDEIEILCILDCPSDGTDVVVNQYACRDNRIKVISNPKNLFVDGCRNIGIDIAQGKYVGFCDHDDYCHPQMFEKLFLEAEESDADVVSSNAKICIDGSESGWRFCDYKKESLISSIILPMKHKDQTQQVSHCIWHSIYRRDFLTKEAIRFPSRSIYMDEDRLFNLEVYLKASRIRHIDEYYYTWDMHMSSTSNTDNRNLAIRYTNRLQRMIELIDEQGLRKNYITQFHKLIAFDLQTQLSSFIKLNAEDSRRYFKMMRKLGYPILRGCYCLSILSRKRIRITSYLVYLCITNNRSYA